ncbi:MAG: hypothetical protein NT154_43600 [Verrucomicrobia bacterium]|nr:hypothetical protein [Verrucomicrobiota bacterium]
MMKDQANQSLIHRLRQRLTRKVRQACLGVALLLAGLMASAAVNYMASQAPKRVQGVPARMAWYVHEGRLNADMLTLASVSRYLLSSGPETPSVPGPENPAVARNTTASPPKS